MWTFPGIVITGMLVFIWGQTSRSPDVNNIQITTRISVHAYLLLAAYALAARPAQAQRAAPTPTALCRFSSFGLLHSRCLRLCGRPHACRADIVACYYPNCNLLHPLLSSCKQRGVEMPEQCGGRVLWVLRSTTTCRISAQRNTDKARGKEPLIHVVYRDWS